MTTFSDEAEWLNVDDFDPDKSCSMYVEPDGRVGYFVRGARVARENYEAALATERTRFQRLIFEKLDGLSGGER